VSSLPVVHRGDAPQLLREGSGAVVEGVLRGGTFASDLVMVRHSNEYRPPAPGARAAP
jgi:cytochrome c-type biogenesis protein CcmE